MEMGEDKQGGIVILRPVGRIDNETCVGFQEQLLRALNGASALVDFTGVEFISSAGLAALMTAAKQAKAKNGRIAVAALTTDGAGDFRHQPLLARRAGLWHDRGRRRGIAVTPPDRRPGRNVHADPVLGDTGIAAGAAQPHAPCGRSCAHALIAAQGRRFETEAEVDRFLDDELPFAVAGTYGGNSSCVEIADIGDQHVICDLGSGAREFGVRVLQREGAAEQGPLQHLPVARPLGPHHGVPVLSPGLHPRERDPHPWLPHGIARGVSSASNPIRAFRSI